MKTYTGVEILTIYQKKKNIALERNSKRTFVSFLGMSLIQVA